MCSVSWVVSSAAGCFLVFWGNVQAHTTNALQCCVCRKSLTPVSWICTQDYTVFPELYCTSPTEQKKNTEQFLPEAFTQNNFTTRKHFRIIFLSELQLKITHSNVPPQRFWSSWKQDLPENRITGSDQPNATSYHWAGLIKTRKSLTKIQGIKKKLPICQQTTPKKILSEEHQNKDQQKPDTCNYFKTQDLKHWRSWGVIRWT